MMGERVVLGIRAGFGGSFEQEHFADSAVIIHGFNIADVDLTEAKSQDDIAKLIKRRVRDASPGSLRDNAAQVWRVRRLQPGDVVVLPAKSL